MAYKRCPSCHVDKEVEEFTSEAGKKMFLCNSCREKSNARARARYELGLAKTYAHQKQFRLELFAKALPEGTQRCVVCLNIKPQAEFVSDSKPSKRCTECREWRKKYTSDRRLTDRTFREDQVEIVIRRHAELRAVCLHAYGDRCVCCGETIKEFLTFEHRNNDGAAHRAQIGKGGAILRWLIKNNFPDTIEILCWNCQWGRRLCGTCPHQQKIASSEPEQLVTLS
jgi:hypothetical protein